MISTGSRRKVALAGLLLLAQPIVAYVLDVLVLDLPPEESENYEQLMARLPEFRLDPAKPPRFHGGQVIGVETLNLVWDV